MVSSTPDAEGDSPPHITPIAIQRSVGITELPGEVISNITLRLGKDDSQAFRLTCRSVEGKGFHEWATEYFYRKAVFILTHSLKTILAIAESPKVCDYVRELSIVPLFLASEPHTAIKHGCLHNWSRSVRDVEAYKFFRQDQACLRTKGGARTLLIRVLTNLPKLRKLTLVESIDSLPFHADAIGYCKLVRLTGVSGIDFSTSQSRDGSFHDFASDVWSILLHAMSKATLKELYCLNVDCAAGFPWVHLKQLQLGALKAVNFKKALSNIKSFSIGIDTHLTDRETKLKNAQKIDRLVSPFANAFSHVESLKLTLRKSRTETLQNGRDWNTCNEVFKGFMQCVNVSGLKVFALHQATTSECDLVSFLSKMRSLKFLEFFDVDVEGGSWVGVLKSLSTLPNLDHLHLRYCTESDKKVYFLTQLDRDKPSTESVGDPDHETLGASDEVDEDEHHPSHTDTNLHEAHGLDRGVEEITRFPDCNDMPYVYPGKSCNYERGYFVCVRGSDIQEMIPTFVKEHNLEDFGEHDLLGAFDTVFGHAAPNLLSQLTTQEAQNQFVAAVNAAQQVAEAGGMGQGGGNGQGADGNPQAPAFLGNGNLQHFPACPPQ